MKFKTYNMKKKKSENNKVCVFGKMPKLMIDKPSIFSGIGYIFDIYNIQEIHIDVDGSTDNEAMRSDFELVNYDMNIAISNYKKERKLSKHEKVI
jgi:hypothetical protein